MSLLDDWGKALDKSKDRKRRTAFRKARAKYTKAPLWRATAVEHFHKERTPTSIIGPTTQVMYVHRVTGETKKETHTGHYKLEAFK